MWSSLQLVELPSRTLAEHLMSTHLLFFLKQNPKEVSEKLSLCF